MPSHDRNRRAADRVALLSRLKSIGWWDHITCDIDYREFRVNCCITHYERHLKVDGTRTSSKIRATCWLGDRYAVEGTRTLCTDSKDKWIVFVVHMRAWDGDLERVDEAGLRRYLKLLSFCKVIEVPIPIVSPGYAIVG